MSVKIAKKFYVSSQSITGAMSDGWARETKEQAIEHAQELLQENKQLTKMYIVQIVAIVKREKPPTTVEDVE